MDHLEEVSSLAGQALSHNADNRAHPLPPLSRNWGNAMNLLARSSRYIYEVLIKVELAEDGFRIQSNTKELQSKPSHMSGIG